MENITSFSDLIRIGGFVMYPLVLCSVLAFAVILEKMIIIIRSFSLIRRMDGHIRSLLEEKNLAGAVTFCSSNSTAVSGLFLMLLSKYTPGCEKSAQIIARKRDNYLQQLRNRLWILGTIGSAAPFIGLLGTVVGIVRAFHSMALTKSSGFSVVAAGISEALVATAAGLIVAITAVIFYNYLLTSLNRTSSYLKNSFEEIADRLDELKSGEGSAS